MSGFVYLLRNETMPGLVKVGKTTRLPDDRSDDLFTTGVPAPFEVLAAVYSDDMDALERTVHEELSAVRVSDRREFFRIEPAEAIKTLMDCFLCDYDMRAVLVDEAIDPGDLNSYARICGAHPWDVRQIIDEITPAAWKAATALHKEKIDRRRRERGQS